MRPAERENQKTRKPENENTFAVFAFSRFRVSRCSHLRASLIASLIDCIAFCKHGFPAFAVFAFPGFRVFAVFAFSRFSRFRVFAVFAFSPFSRFRVFAVFAVFALSRFSRFRVFAFSWFRVFVLYVQSWRFRVFVYLRMYKRLLRLLRLYKRPVCRVGIKTFVVKVLRNGLLRYILHTCPKLW